MLTRKMIIEAVIRGEAVIRRQLPFSKSRFTDIYRQFAPVGAIIASSKKWEQKNPDNSWQEIPMPGILGNSATMIITDEFTGDD